MSPNRRLAFVFALCGCATAALALWYHAKAEVANNHVEQVLRHSPSAIIICERGGKVRFANERLQTYTGFNLTDLQGPDGLRAIIPVDLYPQHAIAFHRESVKPTADRLNYRRVLPVKCKDGKLIQAVVTVSTIMGENNEPEFFAFITPLPELMAPAKPGEEYKTPPPPTAAPATQPATQDASR
jgi:PAS domain S-box-containing protein